MTQQIVRSNRRPLQMPASAPEPVYGELVAAPAEMPAARIDEALDDLRAALDRLGEALDDRVEAEWARLKVEARQGLADLERTLDRLPERARAAFADPDARFDDDRSAGAAPPAAVARRVEPATTEGDRPGPPAVP